MEPARALILKNHSKLANIHGDRVKIISPDNERRNISGNVSDQSVSAEAFQNCFKQLNDYANNDITDYVYWDATNLNTRTMKDIMKVLHDSPFEWDVKIVCLDDSRDWELCYNRVKNDIENGVDRSDSTGNNEESGKPIIQCMSERYCNLVDNVLPEWCKRNNVKAVVA